MSTDALPLVTPAPASLPDDLSVCHELIHELLATLHARERELGQVRHRLDELLRRLYGPKAEKIDPQQLQLFLDALKDLPLPRPASVPTTDADEKGPASAKAKNGHGRQRLPRNLPRQRVEHDLAAADKPCLGCGQERTKIGEEVSEQLDYKPAALFIVEHVRCKYACPHCQEQVAVADKPSQPLTKGLPGPGLVAQVAVSKYADHLPLYRLERIFARHGVELARQTMCDWMAAGAQVITPLYELMIQLVLQSKVLHTDDTPVPVQDPTRDRTRQGRVWVYLGDTAHPYTVFAYTPNRQRDGPAEFLKPYRGYLQADAFGGYDGIYAGGAVVEVACWAHARRKFYEARTSDAARSHAALAWIRRLYDVEDAAKQLSTSERVARRQTEARPLLTAFRQWLQQQQTEVVPKSPFGQAITYALNQWNALMRYTDDGDLAIDNNVAENALRRVAIGRKNWLFAGSDKGGRTAAVWFSVMATCQRHDLDPWAYLTDVLRRLPDHPRDQLAELLPDRWAAAQSAPTGGQ
jgi:transposase